MSKSTKARKFNSSKLSELLGEVSPIEMEQTKVKMQLASHIEDLINARGWTKSQFAEKVRKNPSEITKWLSGTQNFTTEVLTEIAMAFGVDVATLFGKKQMQIVSRKEIVVYSVVMQPSILLITPFDDYRNIKDRNQNIALPITSLLYQS